MASPSNKSKNPSLPSINDPLAQLVGAFLEPFAVRIADRVTEKLSTARSGGARLLTVDQAATYLGRTVNATRHLLAKKALPSVRLDDRIFIDIRDLDQIIDGAKIIDRAKR